MGEIPIYTSKEKPAVAEPVVPLFSRDAVEGVSELARHYEKRQMQDDQVTAIGVEQTHAQWQDAYLDHPETGFLTRRGADAKGGFEAFQTEAERKYLELNDGLENANQRALFEKRFQDRVGQAQDRVAAHEAREADVHRRTVLGDASIREARRAVDLATEGNADGADQAMGMAARFLGQSLGDLPVDQQDEARRMLVSSFHGEVFNRRLDDDPLAAAQYLFVNQKSIDPAIYDQYQQTANQRIELAQGRELFNRFYAPDSYLEDIFVTIDTADAADP